MGRALLLSVALGFALWRFDVWAYDRGYAAKVAEDAASAALAQSEAIQLLKGAQVRHQAAVDQQAADDAAYAAQQAQIHSQGGGDAPLNAYGLNAARQLWP